MSSLWLNSRRRVVTSQHGEDGVIEAIFERIGTKNRWFCEFGAWDGEYLSNTFTLLRDHQWHGVMIEGDHEKAIALAAKEALYPTLHALEGFVAASGPNTLDDLLRKTDIPIDFDLLSIDIDNDDYYVWEALHVYQPRVVVIEVNSPLGPDVEKLPIPNFRGFTERTGCSFASAVRLGKQKGYELAMHTGNCFFVKREYAGLLDIDPDGWKELFDSSFMNRTLYQRARMALGDIVKGRVKLLR